MIKIAPSILSADFADLKNDIRIVEEAGADYLHIDVMDGHFVPNITIGPLVVKSIRKHSKLIFDVHLMIENPEMYIKDFVESGADLITIHAESTHHLHRAIQMIKKEGIKAGVALNPATPVSIVEDILCDLDLVLIMSVNPGFGGQKFIEGSINKIMKLKELINLYGLKTLIQVDGGVNLDNINEIVSAGVDVVVAGSAIYNSKDIKETIRMMKESTK